VAGLEGIESLAGPPKSARFAARISVIPHTRLATGLASKKIGDEVNVELDVLASYVRTAVAALLRSGSVNEPSAPGGPRLDIERLKSWGYR
jgi:riboflavin synthase alpha subunit